MTKYRWLTCSMGLKIPELAARLRRMRFKALVDEDSQGFRIEGSRPNLIAGQFIERETWIERVSLPTGDEFEEARSRAVVTSFEFGAGKSLNLLLTDPPRGLLSFFNAVGEVTNYDCSIEAVQVDVLRWIEALEDRCGKANVMYAECSGVQVSPTVVGRYALRGAHDVRTDLRRILGTQTPTVEVARCDLRLDGALVSVELGRSATAKLDEPAKGQLSIIAEALRTALG